MPSILLYAEPSGPSDLHLAASGGSLYAVVDSCGESTVPERARALGSKGAASLWRGRRDEDLWAIAPYLFLVDARTLEWILGTLGRAPWGIFLRLLRPTRFDRLIDHLQSYVEASIGDGGPFYFRFYDPRVIEPYLQSCTDAELLSFFGPFDAVGVADFTNSRSTAEGDEISTTGGLAWWHLAGGAERPTSGETP